MSGRVDPPMAQQPALEGDDRPMGRWWSRWFDLLVAHVNHIRTGHGTPETFVIAPPGHIYLDLDGGAGVTLYVKESGTGAVGWVAK